VCSPPVTTATIGGNETVCGTRRNVVVLSPSWPCELWPTAQSAPALVRIMVNDVPPAAPVATGVCACASEAATRVKASRRRTRIAKRCVIPCRRGELRATAQVKARRLAYSFSDAVCGRQELAASARLEEHEWLTAGPQAGLNLSIPQISVKNHCEKCEMAEFSHRSRNGPAG
jgi:hypothetical protein